MKSFSIFKIIFIFLISFAGLTSAQAQICKLTLQDLSRFTKDDEKTVNRVALLDFLSKENKILFGKLHLMAIPSAVEAKGLNLEKFERIYKLSSQNQQLEFAQSVWEKILDELNPSSSYYSYSSSVNPAKQADGLIDVDKLVITDIERLDTISKKWDLTYDEYLKYYSIAQSIEKNPAIRKEVINIMAKTLSKGAKIGQIIENHADAMEAWKKRKFGWDWNQPQTGVPNLLGTIGAGATTLAAFIGNDPHALLVVPALITATPLAYSSVKATKAMYRKASMKIRTALLKRSTRKSVEKQDSLPRNDSEEE